MLWKLVNSSNIKLKKYNKLNIKYAEENYKRKKSGKNHKKKWNYQIKHKQVKISIKNQLPVVKKNCSKINVRFTWT